MITHKHLKQLGFSRNGKNFVNEHTGIIFIPKNCVGRYWDLRSIVSTSTQLPLWNDFWMKFMEQRDSCYTWYTTIGGEEKWFWSISVDLDLSKSERRFISPLQHVIQEYGFYFGKIDDKQLSLWEN